jgi:hypothetical protein
MNYFKKYHLATILIIIFLLLMISLLVSKSLNNSRYFGNWFCNNGNWITTEHPYEEKPKWLCPAATPTPLPLEKQLETVAIKIYLARHSTSISACDEVYPVERKIMNLVDQQVIAMEAIDELIKGPTDAEKALGYYSIVSEDNIKPEQITYVNGVITFNTGAIFKARNESFCDTSKRAKQLTNTLQGLPFISNVSLE